MSFAFFFFHRVALRGVDYGHVMNSGPLLLLDVSPVEVACYGQHLLPSAQRIPACVTTSIRSYSL